MSKHEAEILWTAGAGEDFLAGRYSRVHEIRFDGGATVNASASPSVVRAPWSDAAAVDPEEMFVASLSSCHMLWFLDFARRAGVAVRAYHDRAEGTLGKDAAGAVAMTDVVLRPEVDCDADPATLATLHEKAHHACFIANSVKTAVRVEPL
ncbi:MAG: OsmC family protein [Rhizobiaceae bacterium]|nr:OsmC family protein [Rhizobiaceae bacterium]